MHLEYHKVTIVMACFNCYGIPNLPALWIVLVACGQPLTMCIYIYIYICITYIHVYIYIYILYFAVLWYTVCAVYL